MFAVHVVDQLMAGCADWHDVHQAFIAEIFVSLVVKLH